MNEWLMVSGLNGDRDPLHEICNRKARARCPVAAQKADELPDVMSFRRGSGLCICEICGHQRYDHPSHPEDRSMVVDCDGVVWHL